MSECELVVSAAVIKHVSHRSTPSLSVQLAKQYPYVVPKMEFRNVKGLSKNEQRELMGLLETRAKECAAVGSVMMCELVQVVEDYLLAHNQDPNMSAWEQMRAREALQQQEEEEAKREQEKELKRIMMEEHEKTDEHSRGLIVASGGEVEMELKRQMEALAAADRKRRGLSTPLEKEESKDEDVSGDSEDDFDDSDYPAPLVGSSRYQTDFIELGSLGRGGGGEVVKVRNRLDRRLYAVKKIVLESEEVGAIQNRKLRREVTTISRMMHKNIVRYYQAWVEGGAMETQVEEEQADVEGTTDMQIGSQQEGESSGDDSSPGWWTNSPIEDGLHPHVKSRGKGEQESSEGSSDSASWEECTEGESAGIADDETIDMSNSRGMPSRSDAHSASIDDLLSHEQDFQVGIASVHILLLYKCISLIIRILFHMQSPLLAGMGFQNEAYHGMFAEKMKKTSSTKRTSEEELLWEESPAKVDPMSSNRILYIQVITGKSWYSVSSHRSPLSSFI